MLPLMWPILSYVMLARPFGLFRVSDGGSIKRSSILRLLHGLFEELFRLLPIDDVAASRDVLLLVQVILYIT
jgi:hypothetical protein